MLSTEADIFFVERRRKFQERRDGLLKMHGYSAPEIERARNAMWDDLVEMKKIHGGYGFTDAVLEAHAERDAEDRDPAQQELILKAIGKYWFDLLRLPTGAFNF